MQQSGGAEGDFICAMAISSSTTFMQNLGRILEPIKDSLAITPYSPPEGYSHVSIKSHLQSLLPDPSLPEPDISAQIKDIVLLCSALASASNTSSPHLSWVPDSLSLLAVSALGELAEVCCGHYLEPNHRIVVGEFELDLSDVVEIGKKLLIKLIPEVLPLLKFKIKESSIDVNDEGDRASAASAGAPVAYAVLAACQFRWLVTQVGSPFLGKLCALVIPCALTALDHWSPQVKDQGMISFIHLAKNVEAADIGGYGDVILDACCQNIASDDEIWPGVVEMSIRLVTLTQRSNPRSQWYEKLLDGMLSHLERDPRNGPRCIAWLMHCDHLFNAMGLTLLAHFRRFFPLLFKWMHADDDETVLLALKCTTVVLRLTWLRNSPFIQRLIDELVILYKDAALKSARESIRSLIIQALNLIQMSRKQKFDASWDKYKDDPNLATLSSLLFEKDGAVVPMALLSI